MKGNFRKRDSSTNSRKGGNPDNNYTNGGGSSNQNNGSMFYENAETTKNFNDRQDYLLVNSIGSNVTVTVTSGVKYDGLLVSCNLESSNGVDVVLRFPKVVDAGVSNSVDDLARTLGETLLIHGEDVAELELKNIDLSLDEKWENSKIQEATPARDSEKEKVNNELNESGKFRTDVDISRSGKEIKERKLEKWTPEEGTERFDINKGQTLEDDSTAWDQFAVNEKKFGVKSTFDEHLYTTKINKEDPNFGKRLQEAERIAKEIESQGPSGNIHIAEDRGINIDDSGLDEEDLYSGVDRRGDELLAALKSNSKPNANRASRYVPPTLRQQPHNMDPAIISSSNSTNNETVAATTVTTPAEAEAAKEKVSQKSLKSKKGLSSKEAQIEELKKFSEKFKVPYDIPKDMPEVLKRSNSTLKSNSSLPPKPISKTPSAKTVSPTAQVTAGKSESRRSTSNMSQGQSSAAHTTRSSTSSRRRNHGSFFGAKNPHTNDAKRAAFGKSFNMFIKSKEAHDEKQRQRNASESMEPFFIEKPYFTAPTWLNTIEESYKTFFPDENTAIQEAQTRFQQRQMNSMGHGGPGMNPNIGMNMGGMMGFPMGGPNASPTPMMNGFAAGSMGMYMPFQPQPMFYHPSMPQMMPVMGNNGAEDGGGNISPHMPSGFMAGGPGAPMGAFGYPGGMPFQGMMGSGPSGMPASGSAIHSHGHGRNYHQSNHHGHRNNSTSGHK